MSGPVWLRWVFAVACALLAGYRLVHTTGTRRGPGAQPARPRRAGGVAAAHGAMELGMAAMFSPVQPPVPATSWVLTSGVFAAATLLVSGRRATGRRASGPGSIAGARDRAHLAMVTVSMAFAVVDGAAVPSSGHRHVATVDGEAFLTVDVDMLATGTRAVPSMLAWLLASYHVLYAVLSATRGFNRQPLLPGAVKPVLLTGCDVAMSAAMAYMLLTMP